MGKIGCKRWRFHNSAVKLMNNNPADTNVDEQKADTVPFIMDKNIFEKLSSDDFGNIMSNSHEASNYSSSYRALKNSGNQPQKTKKEKFRDRKEFWKNQINSICAQKSKVKEILQKKIERKRMKNTPIVGDLTDMKESLPFITAQKETAKQKPLPYKPPVKLKSRQNEMLDNINLFKQVLNHPIFKQNPGSAMAEHLQNKVEQMNSC